MSSKVNEIKNCSTHQLQIVAVDLKATKEKQEKFLCVKCLIDRVDGNYIVLLKEGLEMIDQMKNKFKEQTISHTQQQQENIKSLQSSVLEMNKLFSDVFTKLQNNFDEIINSNQQDIQTKEKTVEEIDLDQDFETLSDIYKGNSDFDMPKPKIKIDNFKSLMDNYQSQFFSMANSSSFSQTFEQIKKIKSQYQNEFSIDQEFIQIYKNFKIQLQNT
ncbi:unnamed protein product [Paramecium pentaurelia]|uniref:Uncharacterized protein n=1 Tax=Paramecium pentaurelia TaxID=43138 RepID=A0A8S1YCV2_9CILI|nr:unnamed protein product [Paramecium pentaurelia]